MTTRQAESAVQDRTVADYRNAWGYPLELNKRAYGGWLLIGCVAGVVACLLLGVLL